MISIIKESNGPNCCEICGKVADLRPYGPNGEWICFKCGMKDEETTSKVFRGILNNSETLIIDPN